MTARKKTSADARVAAAKLIDFMKMASGVFGGGSKMEAIVLVLREMPGLYAAIEPYADSKEGRAKLGVEMYDHLTGTDKRALTFLSEQMFPGLLPEETEGMYDSLKPMLEAALAGRLGTPVEQGAEPASTES